jgi:TM2 domain-containing membrane protein YozV
VPKKYSSRPNLSIIKITSVICNRYILTNTIMQPKYYLGSTIIHLYVLAQYFVSPTLKFANNKIVDTTLMADHEIYPLVQPNKNDVDSNNKATKDDARTMYCDYLDMQSMVHALMECMMKTN